MSFRYRDPDGDPITVTAAPGVTAIHITTTPNGCQIPLDRVEEFIAGVRDTARQAADAAQAPAQAVQVHICPDTPAVQEAIREIRRAGGRPGVRR